MRSAAAAASPPGKTGPRRDRPAPIAAHDVEQARATADAAGLVYVSDAGPGLLRESAGQSFRYRDLGGRLVRDGPTLGRIKRLAVPPAWTEVWICPEPNGHIQATGRDARGRKQYRYHPDWRAVRDESKYERMIAFGQALPRIRRQVERDLARTDLGREKVLATMVRLLETTLVRVGNEEYARANGSIGLSTMQDRHVQIAGGKLRFEFKGKSGQRHQIELHDPRLARIVRRCQDLPGQELFQYIDEAGIRRDVKSEDVNDYLRQIAGQEFSAKDFRTWAGTVLAALALREFEQFSTKKEAKKNLVHAIEHVAAKLGNTPAVCRKCYIHPVILDSYLAGATVRQLKAKTAEALEHASGGLSAEERGVLAFLEQQLRRPKPALVTALRRSIARPRRSPRRPLRVHAGGAGAATRSPARRSRSLSRQSRPE